MPRYDRWLRVPAFCPLVSAAVAICLIGSSSAGASTTVMVDEGDHEPYGTWIADAKVPTPEIAVSVRRTQFCAASFDVAGCTEYDDANASAQIYIEQGFTGHSARRIFLHELGHVFERTYLYSSDRPMIKSVFGLPDTEPWRNSSGVLSPQEWFAEAAYLCFSGRNESGLDLGFNFKWSSPEIQSICNFMIAASERPPRKISQFKVTIPPKTKFAGTTVFTLGTLSASVTIAGRRYRSLGSCTDHFGKPRQRVSVNTCARNLVVWSRARRKVTVVFEGLPDSPPMVDPPGSFSRISRQK